MFLRLVFALLLATSMARATTDAPGQDLAKNTWYHEEGHPVHALFRRDDDDDDNTGSSDDETHETHKAHAPSVTPAVPAAPVPAAPALSLTKDPLIGNADWESRYPSDSTSIVNSIPQAWLKALHDAEAAGKIPDIPTSSTSSSSFPEYPSGYEATGRTVCSSTHQCKVETDIWDAPDGIIGISFDDGPLPPSGALNQFLRDNKQKATHFYIGQNIKHNPELCLQAYQAGDDLAVHTWSHRYMTSLTNVEVVGELGWCMQIIHDMTGGRVPRYWRPPFGDCDNRVRAIAQYVFGLQTVIWNLDTHDWSLGQTNPLTTEDKIVDDIESWTSGPKSPGLCILQHELSDEGVQAFIRAYPYMRRPGWQPMSLAQMIGSGAYLNALDSTSPVTPAEIGNLSVKPPTPATTTRTVHHSSSTPSGSQTAQSSGKSGSPQANQKSSATHYNAASVVLSGLVAFVAAVMGGVLS